MNLKIKHTLIAMLLACAANSQIITTIAGNGNSGHSPDGTVATNMSFTTFDARGIQVDNHGNVYFPDLDQLRKITTAGIVETIAGTYQSPGATGNGGPAINALVATPRYAVTDRNGNIYFTDGGSTCIRKIDAATGIITAFSNTGSTACSVGDGGHISQARFYYIAGLAIDANDNIYVSDGQCYKVRKITPAGIVSTIAGNGIGGFSGDGGIATNASFNWPGQVAVDKAGNIYIPDTFNNRIRKLSPNGIITTIAGTGTAGSSGNGGPATSAQILLPYSVVIDKDDNLYFNERFSIRKIDPAGIITQYAGTGVYGYSGDGGLAVNAKIHCGESTIAINADGELFFADGNSLRIRKISACPIIGFSTQPQSQQLCSSVNATFSVSASNAASMQWQVNNGSGWVNITNIGIYSGATTSQLSISSVTTAMNGYTYRCVAGNVCGTLESDAATLTVSQPVMPTVTIATGSNNICAGAATSFTATIINGGASPTYQWRKNGVIIPNSNSSQFTDNTLVTGDEIMCVISSSEKCLTQPSAVSNAIVVTANPVSSPTIAITTSANNICPGTTINFTSTTQNLVGTPSYQWQKNGINIGVNAPTYSDNALNNGDVISCRLSSDYGCQVTSFVESNKETIRVVSPQIPVVSISTASTSNCINATVHFVATASNAGATISYQWKKNGGAVGTNDFNYTDNNIANGDIITCEMFTTNGCLASNTAVSNSLVMNNYPDPVPALDKTPTICASGTRTLDAGDFTSYEWDNGSTDRTRVVSSTGQYSVTVTDKNGCTGTDGMIISQTLPTPSGFMPADTNICNYGSLVLNATAGYTSYHWNNNSTTRSIQINSPGTYSLEVTDNNNCKGKETVNVSLKQCMEGVYMPKAFTPNNDGKNDVFRPFVFGNVESYHFTVYNRSGQIVFQSADPLQGWDGRFRGVQQSSNAFAWICTYKLGGSITKTEKGSVTLIR